MTNEEREKHIRIANMLIGVITDLERPILMYQIEKDVAREALENYVKILESQPCEDCIGKEALINELKLGYFNKDLQEGKNDPCVIDAMIDWAIRTVKRQPFVTPQQTRWIPCNERLPEENGNYLVTVESNDGTASIKFQTVDHYGPDWLHEEKKRKVIAWMPLPQPYKAEKEDKE